MGWWNGVKGLRFGQLLQCKQRLIYPRSQTAQVRITPASPPSALTRPPVMESYVSDTQDVTPGRHYPKTGSF